MDQLPRLGKIEIICLLLFTCNYVVSVWRGSLFLWVLGTGYVILLWHSLSLPYNYFVLILATPFLHFCFAVMTLSCGLLFVNLLQVIAHLFLWFCCYKSLQEVLIEPHHEKTCLRGLR